MKQFLRRAAMPLLRQFAFDIQIMNPWVPGRKVKLNTFRHKGYWYHGRHREKETMELFAKLIQPGMTVAEVGGHIGFITQYFSHLVGPTGHVVVFEPGSNNLPYTRSNVSALKNVVLLEKGVGAAKGVAEFFEESLTGQNNSFVNEFEGLRENAEVAYVPVERKSREVEIVTLDSMFKDSLPDFIKIDVEGFEHQVLLGARSILKSKKPVVMVEIQADRPEIWSLLHGLGYRLFDVKMKPFLAAQDLVSNVFALHELHHQEHLARLERPS